MNISKKYFRGDMFKFTQLIAVILLAFFLYLSYQAYDAYRYSKSQSKFQLASEKLNFSNLSKFGKENQQEALLNIFYLSGYLKPASLWHDINSIGKIKDPEKVFKSVYKDIIKSGANQDDPAKFNLKYLSKNFLKNADIDVQDAQDLLLYIAQHAFNRKAGQERNELTSQDWMHKHKDIYMQSARELNLIDSIEPAQGAEYQLRWIAGASRVGVLSRLIYDSYISDAKALKVSGDTSILTGERELWANIDGINPKTYEALLNAKQNKINIDDLDIAVNIGEDLERTEEGKKYMLELAKNNNILLDPIQPFVRCKAGECSEGRFPGRDYANYVDKSGAKLTETLMSRDLLHSFFPDQKSSIVDTTSQNGERPNTSSTAKDAAKVLIEEIITKKHADQKEFKILYQTNNPYIERQTLVTQREVDKLLVEYGLSQREYKIIVEGVGFKCKQDVATIHSELGALLTEKWKTAAQKDEQEGVTSKRDIKTLLFQTRSNDLVPFDQPDVSDIEFYSAFKDSLITWFDEHL